MKDIQKAVVVNEGELAFMRYTLYILVAAVIVLLTVVFKGVYDLNAVKYDLKSAQDENEKLKAKVLLYEQPLQGTQRTVEAVTDMIVKLGKKDEQEAEHLAILEVGSAAKHNVDLSVGLAISFQESKWKTKVISDNGSSIGVKQINLGAWKSRFKDMTLVKLTNPSYNIDIGYTLLAEHIKDYGSLRAALMRYRGSDVKAVNEQYADDVLKLSHAFRKKLAFSQT